VRVVALYAERMIRRLATTTILAGALTLTATPALANKTPRFSFKKPSIVPGSSIGGVKVGMTRHQAVARWGSPDRCVAFENVSWCQYLSTEPLQGGGAISNPFAGFFLNGGKVVAVEVDLPNNSLASKVKKLKTAKGVGLGSAAATVRSKYGIPTPAPGEATQSRDGLKHGKNCTMFYAPQAPYTTITAIDVGICGSIVILTF
jgi:hypothetical protein